MTIIEWAADCARATQRAIAQLCVCGGGPRCERRIRERLMSGQLATGAALLCAALPALAGRPFATEDAGVLDAGQCEIEAFWARQSFGAAPKETGWWFQPGCGLGLRTQLAAGAGQSRVEGESTEVLALVGKTFIRELKEDQAGLTIAYQIAGAKTGGSSYKRDSTDVKGVVTWPFGETLLHVNLGWNRSEPDGIDSTTWAAAVESPVGEGFDLGAEAYGDDRSAAWIGVGARYAVVADTFFVDFSYAVQTDSSRTRLLTVGMKYAFNW